MTIENLDKLLAMVEHRKVSLGSMRAIIWYLKRSQIDNEDERLALRMVLSLAEYTRDFEGEDE